MINVEAIDVLGSHLAISIQNYLSPNFPCSRSENFAVVHTATDESGDMLFEGLIVRDIKKCEKEGIHISIVKAQFDIILSAEDKLINVYYHFPLPFYVIGSKVFYLRIPVEYSIELSKIKI